MIGAAIRGRWGGAGREVAAVLPARAMAYFADRSRTRDTGGSGLGLAICYQLVDALGATFTVRLSVWD